MLGRDFFFTHYGDTESLSAGSVIEALDKYAAHLAEPRPEHYTSMIPPFPIREKLRIQNALLLDLRRSGRLDVERLQVAISSVLGVMHELAAKLGEPPCEMPKHVADRDFVPGIKNHDGPIEGDLSAHR